VKSIILARVSTEEQEQAGNSLPAQITRMKKYCKRNCFDIDETFSFHESAYKKKRDEFDRGLEYIDNSDEKVAVLLRMYMTRNTRISKSVRSLLTLN